MKKFSDIKLIKEGKEVTFLCDEFDEKSELLSSEYHPKLLNMIYGIMDAWKDENPEESGDFAVYEIPGEAIYLNDCYIYTIYHVNGSWKVSGETNNDRGFEEFIKYLDVADLSTLLREMLGIEELTKYYSTSTIKKINEE